MFTEACLGRKMVSALFTFGPAKLFTAGCGERCAVALLAGGGVTLGSVSRNEVNEGWMYRDSVTAEANR